MNKKRRRYADLKAMLTRDILYEMLYSKMETYKSIGKKLGVDPHYISKLAKEYNIPKNYKVIRAKQHPNINMEELKHLYCDKLCSLRAIAKIFGVTHGCIGNLLKNQNVEIRPYDYKPYYESRRKWKLYEGEDISRVYRMIVSRIVERPLKTKEHVHHIDFDRKNNSPENLYLFKDGDIHMLFHGFVRKFGMITPDKFLEYYNNNLKDTYSNYNWLYEQYIKQTRSVNDIAKMINVSRTAVCFKLKKLGIYDLRKPNVN